MVRCDIIAEIGVNHGGSIEKAKEMIRKAKKCKADFAKFQLYHTEELYSEDHPLHKDVKEAELTEKQMKELKEYCDEVGIEFLCTPYKNPELVDALERIGVRRYKIRAADSKNTEFLWAVSRTKKPVILSVNDYADWDAVSTIFNGRKLTLLYCVSKYPPKKEELKLSMIRGFAGFSNHYPSVLSNVIAYILGAKIIEIHVREDNDKKCIDFDVSLTFKELKEVIEKINEIEVML